MKDRKSVFVGNLPLRVTEEQLQRLFERSGDVVNIQIVHSFRKRTSFAFVEFARPDMPEIAITQCVSPSSCFANYPPTNPSLSQHGNTSFGPEEIVVERKLDHRRAPRRVNSAYVRQIHGISGNADLPSGSQSVPGRSNPRRVVTAAPGSTPYHNAQAALDMAGPSIPRVYVTPHHDQPGPSAGPSTAAPAVVSSQSMITPGHNAAAAMAPGGGLAVPTSALSAMAPPFGPNGYFLPSPGIPTPVAAFAGAYGGGFNAPGFNAGGFNAGGFNAGGFNAGGFNAGGFNAGYFNPQQQVPTQQYQGFWMNGLHYIQDPISGNCYPFPAAGPAPPMIDQTPVFGQRSVSAMPYVPAAEHLTRASNETLKTKKSVTFADPVAEGSSSSAHEKDGEDSGEKYGAA